MGPLEGLRVLDLTRLQPGNYATMLLADLGARVLKVEEPGRGDYIRWTPPMAGEYSAAHRIVNRNKLSVTLNLKASGGPDVLLRLLETADLLIESFRPGVMERLGLGYDRLSEARPGLVYAAITGFGQDGPYRDRVGHDINYIALNGILNATGPRGGPPVLPGVQIADLSGAMMAVVGVLAALWRRNSTGAGDFVDVSMTDASLSWLALHLAPWFAGLGGLSPGAGYLNGGFAFYRVYECADGKFLSVGAIEPQFWKALCAGVGREDLIEEQFAVGVAGERVHRVLEETFRAKTRDEWVAVFEGREACVAPVNDFDEMGRDPQILARNMLRGMDGESWPELGVPLRLAASPGAVRLAAPGLGEHNAEVFGKELGLDVSALEADGII